MAVFRLILRYGLFTVLTFTCVGLITVLRACSRDAPAGARARFGGLGTSDQFVLADLARTILDASCGRFKWIRCRDFGEFLRWLEHNGEDLEVG